MLRSFVYATDIRQRTAASKLRGFASGVAVLAIAIGAVVARPCFAAAAIPSSNESPKSIKRLASKEVNGDLVTIRGQVLTPDGRPAAGATVGVFGPMYLLDVPKHPVAMTKTGPDGRFEIAYSRLSFGGHLNRTWRTVTIAATLPGFGFQWTNWTYIDPAKTPVLKLVRDVPIRGRVMNLEGKPVPGVRVRILSVDKQWEKDLDAGFAAMKSDPRGLSRRRSFADFCSGYPTDWNPQSTTDSDGRFTLTGLGADRIVRLDLQGDLITYSTALAVTCPIVPEIPNHGANPEPLRGAEFTLTLRPTRAVVGTIRDAATGAPLAGVGVRSEYLEGSPYINDQIRAETDAKGHYELRGMPQTKGNVILIRPNDDQPYLMREFEVLPERTGFRPVTIDVELHRGVWIRGRVTNKVTGQPVGGAVVQYLPAVTNPFTFHLPEFVRSKRRQHMEGNQRRRYQTDAQGNFKLVALPGPGLISVSAYEENFLKGIGDSEIHVPVKNGSYETYHGPADFGPGGSNAIKEINPLAEARMVWCDFALVPGESVHLTLIDPEGRPAPGCFGLSIHSADVNGWEPVMDSTAEVTGLERDETRRIWILDRERKLGKCLDLKPGNRPRELTVKLEPCATLTGRLVDSAGKSLKGILVCARPVLDLRSKQGANFYLPVSSGSEGQFAYPFVPVGCEYVLTLQNPPNGLVAIVKVGQGASVSRQEWKIDATKVKPGDSVGIGDTVVEVPKPRARRRR